MDLKINIADLGTAQHDIDALKEEATDKVRILRSGMLDYTGWVRLPDEYDRQELDAIIKAAEEIKGKCSMLVVIGIGGSYLGACAAITAMQERAIKEHTAGTESSASAHGVCENSEKPSGVRIVFAGNNISGTYHKRILRDMENEDVCLCVISKSGSTTEIKVAFSIFKAALIKKYGEKEAAERIYAVTDAEKGELRAEADREGYANFIVPKNIGGRYSVLTPVGLLPIAAAGIDIKDMLDGAAAAMNDFAALTDISDIESKNINNTLLDYAIGRFIMMRSGTAVEILEYYEPQLEAFAGWVRQLYGESEGKGGMGLFPTSLAFSTDLHSMEQFLQDGSRIFFETVLNVEMPDEDIVVPDDAGELLAGRSMNDINKIAMAGVAAAHKKAGIGMVRIDVPEITPYYFGQLVYFFEMTCAVTGMMMGIDPFDQPGVENYKAEMRKEMRNNG